MSYRNSFSGPLPLRSLTPPSKSPPRISSSMNLRSFSCDPPRSRGSNPCPGPGRLALQNEQSQN
eukprot:3037120-Rhodomonas_salina.2